MKNNTKISHKILKGIQKSLNMEFPGIKKQTVINTLLLTSIEKILSFTTRFLSRSR